MKEAGIEVIHLSTCMKKMCPRYDEHLKALSKDFEVVGYTHD
jgi:predicted metal-binding protein